MNNRLFSRNDLVRLIIPLIVDQFLQVAVGLSDSIMVARVGEAAVSGVSLVDTVMLLIINIFTALATGGAVIAGQYLGRKDPKTGCFRCDVGRIFFRVAVFDSDEDHQTLPYFTADPVVYRDAALRYSLYYRSHDFVRYASMIPGTFFNDRMIFSICSLF